MSLRPWRAGDEDLLLAAWDDEAVRAHIDGPPQRDRASAARWVTAAPARRHNRLALDLVIEEVGSALGEVGLFHFTTDPPRAEIGWWLLERARGRGHATTAVDLLTGWALQELGLVQVWARVPAQNPRAEAVAQRAGFDQLGTDSTGTGIWART